MSESCEIYVKPHVTCNLIDAALERHSGVLVPRLSALPRLLNKIVRLSRESGYENSIAHWVCCPRAAQNIYYSSMIVVYHFSVATVCNCCIPMNENLIYNHT